VSGRISTRIDDKAATEAKDVVRLSKGEAPGPGAVGAGGKGSTTDRIRSLEEEVAARDKALKEANERVVQLEKTIKDMQRLAEIKSAGMTAAQQQADAKAPAAPKPEATAKPDASPPPAMDEKSPPKPQAEKIAEKPAPKPQADKPKPKPEVKAQPAPPEPSLIDTLLDPLYLGGGAVILLGGLGYWLMRRRRRQETVPEPAAKVAPVLATPEAAASVAPQDAPEAAAAELDPLDEANVYLAHGRDAQAEAILTEAIPKDPTRSALHVKLLEVYALRKDKAAFAKRAEDFHKLTGGMGDDWIKVAAMGFGLDRGNPLYGSAKDASVAAPAAVEAARPDLDFNLDAPAAQTASPAPAPSGDGAIDFEIEVPKLDVPPASPARAAPPAADAAAGLDFKLDLGALDLSLDDKKRGAAPAGEHDAHWHDVQAKFDLAKAYQEMGDKAGAGEILKEVMQEGDAEQQAKAKTLLDGLG
jgi:pilus assembly protein FimV